MLVLAEGDDVTDHEDLALGKALKNPACLSVADAAKALSKPLVCWIFSRRSSDIEGSGGPLPRRRTALSKEKADNPASREVASIRPQETSGLSCR